MGEKKKKEVERKGRKEEGRKEGKESVEVEDVALLSYLALAHGPLASVHHASMLVHVIVPHIQKWKLFPAWVIAIVQSSQCTEDSNRSDRLPYEEKKKYTSRQLNTLRESAKQDPKSLLMAFARTIVTQRTRIGGKNPLFNFNPTSDLS